MVARDSWLTIPAMALTVTLMACGGGGGGEAEAEAEQAGPVVDPATAGAVTGTIAFDGAAPEPETIDMSEEPSCAERHQGTPTRAVVKVGDGLADVFVYVKEGLPETAWPTPTSEVSLDQEGCIYHPHVLGLQTGQTLAIQNSDGILHNINAQPEVNRGFNISQPTTMTSTRSFPAQEIMIPVRCDVHGWMEAYIGVVDHPYFAVTGMDGGYAIENLPAGDYVIEVWHERYGVQTQTVTVVAQQQATADFTYSASMAGAEVPLGEPIDLHDHGRAAADR